MQTYEYEYTDAFGGGANYCWVKRGKVHVPELGLTGHPGVTHEYGGMIEHRPRGLNTVLFVTYCD